MMAEPMVPPGGAAGGMVLGDQDPLAGVRTKLAQMHADVQQIAAQFAPNSPEISKVSEITLQGLRGLISLIEGSARVGAQDETSPIL